MQPNCRLFLDFLFFLIFASLSFFLAFPLCFSGLACALCAGLFFLACAFYAYSALQFSMWVAEFRAWHDSHFLRVTERFDVNITAYYLNTFRERGRSFINRLIIVGGPDSEKAIGELAKEPRAKVVEKMGNTLIYQLPELKGFHNLVADRRFIFIKPQTVSRGVEYWTVAALRKKDLLGLYKNVKKLKFKATVELLSIREQGPMFFQPPLLAELSPKQLPVFEAALREGYYSYPRRTDAKGIAKQLGIPYSTAVEHLRKAERKVMGAISGGQAADARRKTSHPGVDQSRIKP